MPDYMYPWKRFWYPRETSLELLEGGYLYRPETEWAHRILGGSPLEELTSIPCLILLGEPGLGKSQEMSQQQATCERLGEAVLACDFSMYQEQSLLVRNLFDHPTFKEWLQGTHHLSLFLDSLDEGLLSIPILARFLAVEFRRYREQLARLSLRITCRAAEWPAILEGELRELWGDAQVQAFRLAPLRRDDVRVAAKTRGVNADQFLEEVDRKAAVPLANRPITLQFLLNQYRVLSTFPSTQHALYEQGCLTLCGEVNPYRQVAHHTGAFTDRQRLTAAGRLAYLMIFTNHNEIWDGDDPVSTPGESLQLYECSGGTEDNDGSSLVISEPILAEACATAIFSSRGPDRREWAHRSYAEFLAAQYLSSYQLPLPQLLMLFLHTNERERRLVPQLHETAAWLATMQPVVFRAIMETDPEVLLQSDVTTASEQDRARLVTALLALEPEERLWNVNLNQGQHYRKLLHSGLDTQLVAVMSDRTLTDTKRVVAIEIAEACHQQTLSPTLVSLALDLSETRIVREAATEALAQIGDDDSKVKLKPLAIGQNTDDPDDELKGHSLHAVWPTYVTAEELFNTLTPPQRENFIGAYRRFLISYVVPQLTQSDLPIALRWAAQHPPLVTLQGLVTPFQPLIDGIIQLALQHLDEPSVLTAFANLIVPYLLQFNALPGLSLSEQETIRWINADDTRHRLIEVVLPLLTQHTNNPGVLLAARPPLLLSRDFSWLIASFIDVEEKAIQQMVASLIGHLLDSDDPAQVQTVLQIGETFPFLIDEVARHFRAVPLGSPEAEQMKRAWFEQQNVEHALEAAQPSVPQASPSLEQIEMHLKAFEDGEYEAWSNIMQLMRTMANSNVPSGNVRVDLTEYDVWQVLENSLKMRLVEAAKQSLWKEGPDRMVWLELDVMHYHTFALTSYQALYLVFQKSPEYLATLSKEVWERLVSVILTSGLLLPNWTGESTSAIHRRLVAVAHRYAPAELVAGIIRLIEREQRTCASTYWNLFHNVEEVWDIALADVLLEKVRECTLAPECSGCLLSILLINHVEAAKEQAESLLVLPLPADDRERQQALAAALALIRFADDAGWSAVWPTIESDRDFGIQLIASLAYRSDWNAQQLSEEQLTDIYLWMVQQYPSTQPPLEKKTNFIIERMDNVETWREKLLQQLKERGTLGACHALERIVRLAEEQDQARLQWILLEAQTLTRRQTWLPYSPTDLLKVISDTRLRLVQNAEQLLEVVIESLRRLEAAFHDETPAWRDVWDRLPLNMPETPISTRRRRRRTFTYRPIDENEFSDYVKRHLQTDLGQRGIIANREVVIRSDERVDIRIDAVTRTTRGQIDERLSLIIEVKGSWNTELMTAMQTQLVNRYLRDNHCRYGLYLVGWFNCESWDSQDDRKRRTPRVSVEEAEKRLDEQAVTLSQHNTMIRAMILNAAIRERDE